MIKLAIIADDLTGACDSGIKLHNLGCDTSVIVTPDCFGEIDFQSGFALSVNTNTRSISAEKAAQKTARVVSELKDKGVSGFYKKVDSVLRGNTGAEIEACRVQAGAQFALIAPEFPDTGRTINNGRLSVCSKSGKTVSVDAIAAVSSTVPNAACAGISLETVRNGEAAIVKEIERLAAEGAVLIVADAMTNNDMDLLACAVAHFGGRCLPAGSAGWLPYLYGEHKAPCTLRCAPQLPENGYIVTCVGSRHPVSVAQVQQLKSAPDFSHYLVNMNGDLPANDGGKLLEQIAADRDSGAVKPGILITTANIYDGDTDSSLQLEIKNTDSREVVEKLAQTVKGVFELLPVCGLILTGGDTAYGVLSSIGCRRMELLSEPFTGMVVGFVRTADRCIAVATKSGGFGDAASLSALYAYMRGTVCPKTAVAADK